MRKIRSKKPRHMRRIQPKGWPTPWKGKKSRNLSVTYFHPGEGLKHRLEVTYNERGGARGQFKRENDKRWVTHGQYYPNIKQVPRSGYKDVQSDIDKLFASFKRSALRIDPNAKIRENIGKPRFS